MSSEDQAVNALWNTLDQLRRQPHWEREGKHVLAAALREARRDVWKEVVEGITSHRNCLTEPIHTDYQLALDLLLAWCREQAAKETPS